ncbi:hypothetical protein [Thiocapsa marina]|uniref:Uncharacterized protein n=1 Tax=Thiocapsa marina 5811 TaxID=768671 RepID=F9UH45_9GAMM|nr:hypothetical protein [Thiocapsa marina]EGV16449.1 hypothetical protein ThimaDRAFT_4218 [Thiocapsa marina 5811]
MRGNTLKIWLVVAMVVGTSAAFASPQTSMGEIGEGMARHATGGHERTIVEVKHGRHGMDFLYYDRVDGREVLHVTEVKAGGSQQTQKLKLNVDEQSLLKKHGITPQHLGGNTYQITQGSHGYNLVQIDRATKRQANVERILSGLTGGEVVGKQDTEKLAVHLRNLNPALSPVEERLLERAVGKDTTALNDLIQRRRSELLALNRQANEQLRRVERDIASQNYTNQLIRVRSQDGRFSVDAQPLDGFGNPSGQPREIRNLNWKYLRESGPFRRLVKDEVRNLCGNGRLCTENAYKAAIQELESTGNMNKAMGLATEYAKPPAGAKVPSMPNVAGSSTSTSPDSKLSIRHTADPTAPRPPVKRPVASELRKTPLMQQIRRYFGANLGSKAGPAGKLAGGTLLIAGRSLPMAAAMVSPTAIVVATAAISAVMVDSYLDNKIDTHIQGMQTHLDEELKTLGENVNYRAALIMEMLDRRSQELSSQIDELSVRMDNRIDHLGSVMDAGFAGLSKSLLLVDLKQDYGLALQEAQFDDALQSGLKQYDVYLGTGDRGSLSAAENDFTRAQARYENFLSKDHTDSEMLQGFWIQHALSSYYRMVVYAERALDDPRFAGQAVQTFIGFADQIQKPEHLNTVLQILNYAYVSIADVDRDDLAGERLTQAYMQLIDDDLANDRFNSAVASAAMLRMVRDDDQSRLLETFVRYLSGTDADAPEELERLEGDWLEYLDQREYPQPGTCFALLACAGSTERSEIAPDFCNLTADALVTAANACDNEAIHRYVVTALLRDKRVDEAKRILDEHYISDPSFRIKNQMTVAYFLRDDPDVGDRYCRIGRFVIDDPTFPDDLRRDVRGHLERWGNFCLNPV